MRTNRQARQILNLDHWHSNQRKVTVSEGSAKPTLKSTGRKKKA
ncbi:stationary-phase-induced ribosome-associated protein [Siccibacter colletis]|uniref:Stationary-phase-induced ribosome-associated protein n=1 Tax=Siccibacter colletis TaxID=1505757 RepID=A0ABY6JLQ0_9ENTR|nr:stationary-phase-induced ribosome-associated protein [Siccibacter colletis]UYU33661.1 stationary-phase-induced ribosome-associated protein [Siccibacter colletis]WNN50337.1 stationary-phase-induced ribosome-associated protein [Siccibacter colletis]